MPPKNRAKGDFIAQASSLANSAGGRYLRERLSQQAADIAEVAPPPVVSEPGEDAEGRLVDQVGALAADPLGFVRFAFPWGEAGTPLADRTGPRRWQAELLAELGDVLRRQHAVGRLEPIRIARASGHGVGKSAMAAWLLLWGLVTMPNARVVITANTEPQLTTKTWPEILKWMNLLICRHWFRSTATRIESVSERHAASWRADALPWSEEKTESFAGLHNEGRRIVLLFDESSAISDMIWEVAEGALTDENTEIVWAVFGNPTRTEGRLRDCFGRFAHRWRHKAIDSRDVEGTNKALFEQWVRDYGEDSDFVRVRVRGMFPHAAITQFYPTDIVEGAATREVYRDQTAPLIMGVDVARGGDAASVMRFRRARDARTIPPIKVRTRDTMEFAARIADAAALYDVDAIFVDAGGVGGGVVDRLRRLTPVPVSEVFFGNKADRSQIREMGTDPNAYANKRAEMHGNCRDWLKTGAIDDDQELKADLLAMEYGFVLRDGRDAILLTPKEMTGRTCDDGDALALTFAYPVSGRNQQVAGAHKSDYNALRTFLRVEDDARG